MNNLEQLIFNKYKDDEILNPILSEILWTDEETELKGFLNVVSTTKNFKEVKITPLYGAYDYIKSISVCFDNNPDYTSIFSAETGRFDRLKLITDKIEEVLTREKITRKQLYSNSLRYQEIEDFVEKIGLTFEEWEQYTDFHDDEMMSVLIDDDAIDE